MQSPRGEGNAEHALAVDIQMATKLRRMAISLHRNH